MNFEIGFCRISVTSESVLGQTVMFGEIKKITKDYVLFAPLDYGDDGIAMQGGIQIKTKDIEDYTKYDEDELPPYE